MTFALFVTDGLQHWQAPYLFACSEGMEQPPHPQGKVWNWALTSSEDPRHVLIGPGLVRILKRRGWVISNLPLEQLLRLRPVEPNLAPLLPLRSRRRRRR